MLCDLKCLGKHMGLAICILAKLILTPFVKASIWIQGKLDPKPEPMPEPVAEPIAEPEKA